MTPPRTRRIDSSEARSHSTNFSQKPAKSAKLISNVVAEWLPTWSVYVDPIERFDTVVFSCNAGLRKPGEAIFLKALELSGFAPNEVLYLDDGPHMVDVARRLGMHGVVVNEHASAIAEARAFL